MQSPIVPTDGMIIRQNTTLVPGVYFLPRGISIEADGVTLDGNGALIVGAGRLGQGVRLTGRSEVTVRNLRARDYYHGISVRGCRGLTIHGNEITSTAETPPNTVFLDIWRQPEKAYGGAIFLWEAEQCRIEANDLQHQQSGILTYQCRDLSVVHNLVNYNSGFGIHLYGTCSSLFEGNSADYCCRFEPRQAPEGGSIHYGHMGADATGFLAVSGASHNVFRRNTARLGGDGFFLAGLSPEGAPLGCDHNLFEENDASLSPNIAFEATFCRGNVFRKNLADRSNYGFWLGFSWDAVIEENRALYNRQAGVAVENGHGFQVRGNTFQRNGHGVLIWSKWVQRFAELYPEHLTSYEWMIESNNFTRNDRGIRIAADQDHGIRAMPSEQSGREETRPRDHRIQSNDIQDNRVGIELARVDGTRISNNLLARNIEANIRQDDCRDTAMGDNTGSAGGYL